MRGSRGAFAGDRSLTILVFLCGEMERGLLDIPNTNAY